MRLQLRLRMGQRQRQVGFCRVEQSEGGHGLDGVARSVGTGSAFDKLELD